MIGQSPGFTGNSVGQTIGKGIGGTLGYGLGGPLGGLLGGFVGKQLGGSVGAGLSSLFGPHGIPAMFGQQGAFGGGLSGISMLTGRLAGQSGATISPGGIPFGTVPANFGTGVTQSAGGWNIDASGNLVGGAPEYNPTRHALVSQSNQGPGAFAMNNMANVRARNII